MPGAQEGLPLVLIRGQQKSLGQEGVEEWGELRGAIPPTVPRRGGVGKGVEESLRLGIEEEARPAKRMHQHDPGRDRDAGEEAGAGKCFRGIARRPIRSSCSVRVSNRPGWSLASAHPPG